MFIMISSNPDSDLFDDFQDQYAILYLYTKSYTSMPFYDKSHL